MLFPDLSAKVNPASFETYVLLEPNAATITLPSGEIFKAVHAPVVTVAPVRPASPTFHFFKPAEVASQA